MSRRKHGDEYAKPYGHSSEILRDIDRHRTYPLFARIAAIDVQDGERVVRMYERER